MPEHEIIEKESLLAPFDPVEAAIAEFKEKNESLVFDYEDSQGNKDARSHIYSMRRVKSRIVDIHKDVKANALKLCRVIDDKKNRLTAAVDEMIEVHARPIRAIEERQKAEAEAKARAEREAKEAEERARLEAIRKQEEELATKKAALEAEEKARAEAVAKKEAEIAAREAAVREAEAARKAAEEAERLAVEKAEREKREAEERHQAELKAAEAKRVADLKAAQEKAAREKAEREAAEARRIAAEKAEAEQKAAEERKRQENLEHRKKINREVLGILTGHRMPEENAKELIRELVADQYPALKIVY